MNATKNDKSPTLSREAFVQIKSGGVLLSQGVYPQVPSALTGLTAVFGMGTGVSPSLRPPEIYCQLRRTHHHGSYHEDTKRDARSSLKDSRASTSINPSPRPISTGQLKMLPSVHFRPINVVISPRALLH